VSLVVVSCCHFTNWVFEKYLVRGPLAFVCRSGAENPQVRNFRRNYLTGFCPNATAQTVGRYERILGSMPTFTLEAVDQMVHLIRESKNDNKGRRSFTTKCGKDVGRDEVMVTVWDSDITCPGCAVPWV
jgi:hypothetical protein